MSRPRAFFTTSPGEPFPFNRTAGDPAGVTYAPLDGITLAQMMRTWFLEDEKALKITIHTDPAVPPFIGATDYSITLTRVFAHPPPSGVQEETSLLWPGAAMEFALGHAGVSGAFIWQGIAQWGGSPTDPGYQGTDPYWNVIRFDAELSYCGTGLINGWKGPGDPDYPLPKERYTYALGNYSPTFRLRVIVNYDAGTEGIFYLQSFDPLSPPPGDPPGGYNFTAVGSFEGVDFDYQGIDLPQFLIIAPTDLEIVTTKWFPYAPAAGGPPIYDENTGDQLLDPLTEPTD